MKNFSAYFHETDKIYEFRIKMAHVEPKGEVLDRIKNALNCFQVETISAVKRLPITEHWEFAKEGACECYTIDVGVRYPTIAGQVRQLIGERAGINAAWVHVKTMQEAMNDDMVWGLHDSNEIESPLLTKEDLGGQSAQQEVGNNRLSNLIKELSAHTRKFEIAGTDTTIGGQKDPSYGKTTNDITAATQSPVGSLKNKLQGPRGA
jgi:hypothetical protein